MTARFGRSKKEKEREIVSPQSVEQRLLVGEEEILAFLFTEMSPCGKRESVDTGVRFLLRLETAPGSLLLGLSHFL